MLNLERTDVYQSALDFAVLAHDIVHALPETESFIARELSNSTLAIPISIAEAALADTESNRDHHRTKALGKTHRSAAAIDILAHSSLVTPETAARAKEAAAKVALLLRADLGAARDS